MGKMQDLNWLILFFTILAGNQEGGIIIIKVTYNNRVTVQNNVIGHAHKSATL